MPKAIAPTFREGVTLITGPFFYSCHEGQISYLHGSSSIFTHAREDEAAFRLILCKFFVNGLATQACSPGMAGTTHRFREARGLFLRVRSQIHFESDRMPAPAGRKEGSQG